jgi:hypothetical protein
MVLTMTSRPYNVRQMDQETQTDEPKRKRVNLTLTELTHGRIKVWCAREGVTMQGQIEKWLDAVAEKAAQRDVS